MPRTPHRGSRIAVALVIGVVLLAAMLALGAGPAAAGQAPAEPSYCPKAQKEAARAEVDQAEREWWEFIEWDDSPEQWEVGRPLQEHFEQLLRAYEEKVEEGWFEPWFKARPGIDWSDCDLEGANLSGADLEGADLSGADLEGAGLLEARLSGADLTGVFGAVRGEPASLPEHWKFVRDYYGYYYGYLVGPGADLYGADLRGAELYETDLAGADLYGADLYEAELTGADLTGANLAGADLEGVSSGRIVGVQASLPEHWMLVEGYLIGPEADLRGAYLKGADLHGADLARANLGRAYLSGADLHGADLANANLGGIDLEGADLEGANLTGDEKELEGAELAGANLSGDDLAGFDLEGAELQGADLTGADLTGANLEAAGLQGADLTGANLVRALLEGVSSGGIVGVPASLPEHWMLVGGYLIGPEAELNWAELQGANLHGADLEQADLEDTELRGADLTGADLAEASLTGAHLEGADLEGADLAGAYLGGANLTGANLTGVAAPGAEWADAICPDGKSASLHIAGSCLEALAPLSPTVETGSASSITSSSATLNGAVNPNGEEVTSCVIEYGTSAALIGATQVSCGLPGSGTSPVGVSAAATGLSANTAYYFRVDAENAGGKGEGTIQSFTTKPNPPTVETGPASSVTHTSATLSGSVNPNGGAVTGCVIEYGTTLPSGTSVPCTPSPGSGTAPVGVSGAVGGLAANTAYEYRLIATNAGGTNTSAPRSFTTAPIAAPEFGRCVAVQAGHGRFSSSKCTSEGGKGGYEWAPGAVKPHVTFSGGAVKLETASKKSVSCAGVSGQGSYGAFKELTGVTLTFTGCHSAAGQCSSTGASAGEVRSAALTATLVWTSKASKTIALDFVPSSASSLFAMQCGSTSATVDGSVLVPVKTDKTSATSTLAFKASKGAQKPTEYETSEGAHVKDALEVSFAGGPAEPIGLTMSVTQTSEEPVEISSTI